MRVLVALGVSAAVHTGLVLWAAQRPEPQPRVVAPEPGTPFEVFEAEAPRPAPAPAAPQPATPSPRPRVAALPVVQETSPVEVAGVAEPMAAPAEAEAAPAVAVAAAPAPAPVAPTRTFDVTALHAALAESARRCYPAAAKRYRLAGEATVAFCLDAAGNLTSTKLASSTGESLLDDAARECVVAGALPLPAGAAGGCYQVPVRFGAR